MSRIQREIANCELIDSGLTPIDAEDANKLRAEHLMADPQETEAAQTVTETPVKAEEAEVKKKAPRQKRAVKAEPKR